MNESLPIAFAIYPLFFSGIAFIWLFRTRHQSWPNWLGRELASGSIVLFAYLTGSWAFTSYYLRYIILGLFAVITVLTYFRTKRSGTYSPERDGKIRALPILAFILFSVLDALAIASHYPSGKTLDVTFPLSSGTYYVLQGGASAVTNPFHAMGSSKFAIDIVKLNSLGNRADGIAPRALSAYEIFGDKLFSPCQGSIAKVRDRSPDNFPGHSDTEHPEGNYVVLKCAETDILMAHLKRGSIKVAPGEMVTEGQPLAEIGNSGNTLEPHLHIEARKEGVEMELRFNGRSLSINSVITGKKRVHNNGVNSDVQERRLALLSQIGYGKRWAGTVKLTCCI